MFFWQRCCFSNKKKPPAGLHQTEDRAGDAPKPPFPSKSIDDTCAWTPNSVVCKSLECQLCCESLRKRSRQNGGSVGDTTVRPDRLSVSVPVHTSGKKFGCKSCAQMVQNEDDLTRLLPAGLGKSRQVGHDRKSWNAGYCQLG